MVLAARKVHHVVLSNAAGDCPGKQHTWWVKRSFFLLQLGSILEEARSCNSRTATVVASCCLEVLDRFDVSRVEDVP